MASTTPKKTMQLNFFDTACAGSHVAIGFWSSPTDNTRTKDRIEYYLNLAKTAERGKITTIFFADTYGQHNVYGGSEDAAFIGGSSIGKLDPTMVVAAMGAVTKSVGFGITGSISYIPPYMLARTWATMDHLTNGRAGWNIVTSYSNSAAQALGKGEVVLPHDERYALAEEYMEVVYRLWEESWEDGAQVFSADPKMAYDPTKIHRIEHKGKYFSMAGAQQTHPSPQRTPVLFQAGSSIAGNAFGAKHSEVIFTGQPTLEKMKAYSAAIRAQAKEYGRDPSSLKIIQSILPIIGKTEEEAKAKFEYYKTQLSIEGGLARFGGFTGIDLSGYALDEPFKFEGTLKDNATHSAIKHYKDYAEDQELTPRLVGEINAFGGLGPRPCGSAEQVADFFEKWFIEADIDGFNISYVESPGSFEDVVDLLVPELQKRGLYWTDYPAPGGTLRENLQNTPGNPLLPDDHPGAQYKWNAKKEASETVVEAPKTN